jgi:hypothetical protein
MADIEDLDKDDWDNLSSSEQTDIREDVENLSSTGFKQLSDDKKNWLIREAISEASTLYTGKYSRLPTVDGDAETFRLNLAAHKMTIAEGGEAQSESNAGGNVSYNTVTGDAISDLQHTRFGRTALKHVRDRQGIGIVRSRL